MGHTGNSFWLLDTLLFFGFGLPFLVAAVVVGVQLAGPGRATGAGWSMGLVAGLIMWAVAALVVCGPWSSANPYGSGLYLILLPPGTLVGGLVAWEVAKPTRDR